MDSFPGHPLIGPGVYLCDHVTVMLLQCVWKPIAMGQHTFGLHLGISQKEREVVMFPTLLTLVLYSPSSLSYYLFKG